MNKTTYLVTGIAGNLGGAVASQLLSEGKNVVGLVLDGDPAAARVPNGVKLITGDVTNSDSIEQFFEAGAGTDIIVIHCAAIVTVNPNFNQKVMDVNFGGTKKIVDACIDHRVKKLVYVGSTGGIPEAPHGTVITEPENYDPKLVVGCYGESKALASQYVRDAALERGLDASLVFPTGICGVDDYSYGMVASFIIDYCNGDMPAGVDGSFNAVDARDLAAAIIAATEKGRPGEGYILGNECVSLEQMFHLISTATGVKEVKTILPAGAARLLGKASDIAEKITKKPQRMTSFAVYNLLRNNTFDCSKAKRELGFSTRPFAETISDIIAWLAREGKIQISNSQTIAS